jgi:hypothetical protein
MVAILLAVVFLLVVTVHALGSSGGRSTASTTTSTGASAGTSAPPASTPAPSSSVATSSAAAGSTAATGAVQPCPAAQLKIVAASDKPSYKIGEQPVVAMQVTNIGPTPCSEALGDAQIEFRIYNGAARVWGSHDCKIDQTPDVETLPVNSTVAKTVTWSGYSSETNCGTRQRVGAGTYTLSVYLAGTLGTTAQFAITA